MAESPRTASASGSSKAQPAATFPSIPDNTETPSVQGLRSKWQDRGQIAGGQLLRDLLSTHPQYVTPAIRQVALDDNELAGLGPARTVDEHLAVARSRWDMRRVLALRGRNVVLGLAF